MTITSMVHIMSPENLLNVVDVATPCPADWDSMTGDDRSRFCGQCRKHVYNLSAMSASDAVDLIREKETDLCIRIYRRNDGTVLNGDCPVGAGRVWKRTKRLCTALVASGLLVAGMRSIPSVRAGLQPQAPPVITASATPGPVSLAWLEWIGSLKEWLGFSPPPISCGTVMGSMVMGDVALPPDWDPGLPPVDSPDLPPPPPSTEPDPG